MGMLLHTFRHHSPSPPPPCLPTYNIIYSLSFSVPLLNLTKLNEPDDQMKPVVK